MKIGDKVRFLNAVGGGIVRRFQGKDMVLIEEENGFEMPVLIRECIVVDSSDMQVNNTPEVVVKSIEVKPVRKPKDTGKTIVEIDLHSNELLDTTAGMSNTDIFNIQLAKFTETMVQYKSKKGQKIVFIHGKGEGVLRTAILQELKTKYKNCPYQDASFKEYGFGATMVTIK